MSQSRTQRTETTTQSKRRSAVLVGLALGVALTGTVAMARGKKIIYYSRGVQTSNPEGDSEVYSLNTNEGTGQTNLTDNGLYVEDFFPAGFYSPDGTRIVYESQGTQPSTPRATTKFTA